MILGFHTMLLQFWQKVLINYFANPIILQSYKSWFRQFIFQDGHLSELRFTGLHDFRISHNASSVLAKSIDTLFCQSYHPLIL